MLCKIQAHPKDADEVVVADAEDDEARGSCHTSTWTTETSLYICGHNIGHVHIFCLTPWEMYLCICVFYIIFWDVYIMLSLFDLYLVPMYMLCFDFEIKACLVYVFRDIYKS